MSSTAREKELMIALNTTFEVPRASLCRLGFEPAFWLREGAKVAAAIGVPARHVAKALALAPRAAQLADEEQAKAAALGIEIVTRWDESYPEALFDLPLPPPVLYRRGVSSLPTGIAIVGPRAMDHQGQRLTALFARELVAAGLAIYSGFARGVDATAHRETLESGGRTVAVLGCGLDLDYPRGSRKLAEAIVREGALLSEFPLGAAPQPFNFPIRNRLIAALARATLVVQAQARSGSLNTAHHAMELGRDVFAIPGSLFDELAVGTNALIADGALVALSPRDLLTRLGYDVRPAKHQATLPELTRSEALPRAEGPAAPLLDQLGQEGRTAEDLADAMGTTVDKILGQLLDLELQGYVVRRPGPVYCRT